MEDKELLAWFLEHSNDGSLTELIQFKKFNFKGFTKINTPKKYVAISLYDIHHNMRIPPSWRGFLFSHFYMCYDVQIKP